MVLHHSDGPSSDRSNKQVVGYSQPGTDLPDVLACFRSRSGMGSALFCENAQDFILEHSQPASLTER